MPADHKETSEAKQIGGTFTSASFGYLALIAFIPNLAASSAPAFGPSTAHRVVGGLPHCAQYRSSQRSARQAHDSRDRHDNRNRYKPPLHGMREAAIDASPYRRLRYVPAGIKRSASDSRPTHVRSLRWAICESGVAMNLESWKSQTMSHWKEFQPTRFKELVKTRTLQAALDEAPELTYLEMNTLMAQGFQEHEA